MDIFVKIYFSKYMFQEYFNNIQKDYLENKEATEHSYRTYFKLSEIGWELIQHHLLKRDYLYTICSMQGTGNNYKVEKVEFEILEPKNSKELNFLYLTKGEKAGRVWINKERYFEPIPLKIWNFYIGGYQVLDKWLKERKKHSIILSSEDILHFSKVVNVIDETIKTMQEIDKITKEWI